MGFQKSVLSIAIIVLIIALIVMALVLKFAKDNFFSSSSGLINLFQSCVPIGNHLKIYSAPTIAFMYETIVLFNVAVNIMPFFFKRLLHDLI